MTITAEESIALTKKLNSTTSAAVWGEEFMRLHGGHRLSIDEGLMISWFANAIEVGREAGRSAEQQRIQKNLQNLLEELE